MAEISLSAYRELISERIEQGHWAEAVAHIKHILTHYPHWIDGYRLLGEALLEARQEERAIEMFRRVLSADPEELMAWVGLSECYDRQGNLDAAVWHMERAFELTSDNAAVEQQYRRLLERQGGVEIRRVQLTPVALARLYLRGGLLARAVNQFRALAAKHPERMDVRVAFAEALWRNNQRLEAIETCQQILDELPYCLKANLILGEIWSRSGQEEAQFYLQRAEALDPENMRAHEWWETFPLLPKREVLVSQLEYQPEEEAPTVDWEALIRADIGTLPATAQAEEAPTLQLLEPEAEPETPRWLEALDLPASIRSTAEAQVATEAPPEQQTEETAPALRAEDFEFEGALLTEGETAPTPEQSELNTEEILPSWLIEETLEENRTIEAAEEPTGIEELPEWLISAAEMPVEEGTATSEHTLGETFAKWEAQEEILAWLEQIATDEEEEQMSPEEIVPEAQAQLSEETPPLEEETLVGVDRLIGLKEEQVSPEPLSSIVDFEPRTDGLLERVVRVPVVSESPPQGSDEAPAAPRPFAHEAMPEAEATLAPPIFEEPGSQETTQECQTTEIAPVEEVPLASSEEGVEFSEAISITADAVARMRAHLQQHPRDYTAWLELARLLLSNGDLTEALKAYRQALHSGRLAESIISDLEASSAAHTNLQAQQLLGDAYMKAGRLEDALRVYRQALNAL